LINDSWVVEFVSGAATTGNNQYRYLRYVVEMSSGATNLQRLPDVKASVKSTPESA